MSAPAEGVMAPAADALSVQAAGARRLDDLLQHRTRLGACALLATTDALSFSRLRELLAETDGNLGANLKKLEEAGYIAADKSFVARKPVTTYTLTSHGRQQLKAHLAALKALIGA